MQSGHFEAANTLGAPIVQVAWSRTANMAVLLDGAGEVSLVRNGGSRVICSAAGDAIHVGVDGAHVYWTTWTQDSTEGTSRVFRADENCSSLELVFSRSGQVLWPITWGTGVLALAVGVDRSMRLVEYASGAVRVGSSEASPVLALCPVQREAWLVTRDGVDAVSLSGERRRVHSWSGTPQAFDCDGDAVLVAEREGERSKIWRFVPGGETSFLIDGWVDAVGLSVGGWFSTNGVVRLFGSLSLVTAAVVDEFKDVWVTGEGVGLRDSRGRVFRRLMGNEWEVFGVPPPEVELTSQVWLGADRSLRVRRGTMRYFVEEVSNGVSRPVMEFPESTVFGGGDSRPSLRVFDVGACSGEPLVGLSYGRDHWLLFPASDQWSSMKLPVERCVAAFRQRDQVVVLPTLQSSLVWSSAVESWEGFDRSALLVSGRVAFVDLPSDSLRVLGGDGAWYVESSGTVSAIRADGQTEPLADGVLLGLSAGVVSVGQAELSFVRARGAN